MAGDGPRATAGPTQPPDPTPLPASRPLTFSIADELRAHPTAAAAAFAQLPVVELDAFGEPDDYRLDRIERSGSLRATSTPVTARASISPLPSDSPMARGCCSRSRSSTSTASRPPRWVRPDTPSLAALDLTGSVSEIVSRGGSQFLRSVLLTESVADATSAEMVGRQRLRRRARAPRRHHGPEGRPNRLGPLLATEPRMLESQRAVPGRWPAESAQCVGGAHATAVRADLNGPARATTEAAGWRPATRDALAQPGWPRIVVGGSRRAGLMTTGRWS